MKAAKPITSSACHCINLRRAANAVTGCYDKALAGTGLTLNQYSMLSNLQKLEPCSVAELSRQMRLERTTLVRNLKAMYAAGWIYDEAPPGNRKSQMRLTQAGAEKVREAKPLWKQAQEHLEAYLGKETLQKLTETLLYLERLPAMQQE